MMRIERFSKTAQIGRHFVLPIFLLICMIFNALPLYASDLSSQPGNLPQPSPDPSPSIDTQVQPNPNIGNANPTNIQTDLQIAPTSPIKVESNTPDANVGVKVNTPILPPFKITGSLSRRLQAYSGMTASSEFITNLLLHYTLKKLFGGKIKIRIKTYSFTDLWYLKVKKAKVSMAGSHYKDIPLGKVEVESQTPFWFVFKHRHLEVKNPSLFNFKMSVSESELDQILHSPKVTNSLRALRLDLASIGPGTGEQRIQMHEPRVTINDDSIMVKVRLATQGSDPSTAVLMTISGKPKLRGNDCVYLEEVKIDSEDITDPEKFSKFVENLINPLINLHRFDKANFALRLDDISVKSKSVSLAGRLIIGPRIQNKAGN
jgi:hypothetical protein